MKVEKSRDLTTSGVLSNIGYFTEWGGYSWRKLCRHALLALGDLHGKTVLEIGPRFGKMSCCFALLGAKVIGVETNAAALMQAEKEIRKWGVEAKVTLLYYDGDLDHCVALKQLEFDLVFTKSVLVCVGDSLSDYLQKINRRLKYNGRCIFIENRHGGPFFSSLRKVLPRSRNNYQRVTYFRPMHLAMINELFSIVEIKKSMFPPIYLILAKKKLHLT